MAQEPDERERVTGRDVRTAYEAMRLRRSQAAELIGISEARLATLEHSDRPLFALFNWEVLAALGNEHHRRQDEAGLPECEWIVTWAAESLSDEALATQSEADKEAAEEDRQTHLSVCELCRPGLEWSEANPDPIAFLFPAADRPIDKAGRWLPLTALILCIGAGVSVAGEAGNQIFRGAGFVVGLGIYYVLQRARRRGYLP